MKSNFFKKNDVSRSEAFKKDAEILVALEDSVLLQLAEHAKNVELARGDRETDQVREAAARALQVPRAQLDHALGLGAFFLRQFLRTGDASGDAPEDIVSDFRQIVSISDEKTASVTAFFKQLKKVVGEKAELEILRQQSALKSLPVLKSITTTVNYRAVFDDYFKPDADLVSYAPNCIGIIPVAIINLSFSEGLAQEVYFQADGRTIKILIDHLRALQREFEILRARYPTKEDESHASNT